MAPELDDLH
jgi:hypothetical protein